MFESMPPIAAGRPCCDLPGVSGVCRVKCHGRLDPLLIRLARMPGQKHDRLDFQCMRNAFEALQGEVPLTSFHGADVRPVEAAALSKRLLGHAALLPDGSNPAGR
jgi:hypothetical protein